MAREPKIYLDYTQAQLNEQYNQATLVPDPSPYIEDWRASTDKAKSILKTKENIAYGSHEDELMDLYLPDREVNNGEPYPLLVICHGGAWRSLSKDESGYLAPSYIPYGIALAALNFGLAPAYSLHEIVGQVRRAVLFLYQNGVELSVNPEKIFVLGHSSGAHLAANLAVTDWPVLGGPHDLIKGLTAISGPYDLEPVRLSARNDYLNLTEKDARALSPNKHLRPSLPPAIIAWGGEELDEFKRQGADLANAWSMSNSDVARILLPGKNHFEMGNENNNPNSSLFQATLKQINDQI